MSISEMSNIQKSKGFTLMEIFITVAIIGIIAAVAWPAFERQSNKNRRSDAAVTLTNARQALIADRSDNGVYPADIATAANVLTTYLAGAPNAPEIDCKSGRGYRNDIAVANGVRSCQGYYNVTVTAADNNSFTLTATPILFADAECTTLTLDHLSTRGRTGTAPVARCWAQ